MFLFQKHLKHEEWELREAALLVFGHVVEGPSSPSLKPLAEEVMPILIESLAQEECPAIKNTAVWVVGRLVDLVSNLDLASH